MSSITASASRKTTSAGGHAPAEQGEDPDANAMSVAIGMPQPRRRPPP